MRKKKQEEAETEGTEAGAKGTEGEREAGKKRLMWADRERSV